MALTASVNPEFTAKAATLAELLGAGWTVEPEKGEYFWCVWLHLKHESGLGIALQIEDRNPTRINIEGEFPPAPHYGPYPSASITVAASKTAEQIAADIKRRLLPDYQEKFAVALAEREKLDNYERRMDAARARLNTHSLDFGTRQNGFDTSTEERLGKSFPGYGTVRISGPDNIDIHTRGLSLALAEKVLDLLRENSG